MATTTWHVTGGVWSNQNNWFGFALPGTADTVLLGGSGPYTTTADIAFTVGAIDIAAASVTLDVAASLTVAGDIAVASGAAVEVAAALTAGTLDLSGGGKLLAAGGTLAGTTLLGGASDIVSAGAAPGLTNQGTIAWSSVETAQGDITIGAFGFDNAGQMDFAPATQMLSVFVTTTVEVLHGNPVAISGQVNWIQTWTANLTVDSPVFANSGQIAMDGGTLTLNGASFDNSGSIRLLGIDTTTIGPIGTTDGIPIVGTIASVDFGQIVVGADVAAFVNTGTITAASVVFQRAMTLAQLGTINGGLSFDAGLDLGGGTLSAQTLAVGGVLQDGSIGGTGTLTLQSGATLDNVAIGAGVTVLNQGSVPVVVVDPPLTSVVTLDQATNELDFRTVSSFDGGIVLGPGASSDVIGVFTVGGVTLGPDFSFIDSQPSSLVTFGGSGTLQNQGTWTVAGAAIAVGATLDGSGLIQIADGATLSIATLAATAAPAVAFGAGSSTLVLPGTGAIGATLSGLAAGDSIDLASVSSKLSGGTFGNGGAEAVGDTLDVTGASGEGAKIPLGSSATGLSFTVVPDGSGGSVVEVACFATGTRIAAAAGDVPVEQLRAGDLVWTQAGRLAPVRWLGHRRIDCRRHPRPGQVLPVRIAADAFAPGVPARPLLLSPDHAVFLEGVLIPVRALLNGGSIAQLDEAEICYWHVQLDRHDILLAEGVPAESYLDTGNRAAFGNGGTVMQLHADFSRRLWDGDACAKLVVAGPLLDRVRARLNRTVPAPAARSVGG